MEDDTPTASWHPAMMPNSNDDPHTTTTQTTSDLAPDAPSTPALSHQEIDHHSPAGGALLNQLKNEDEGDSSGVHAWDLSNSDLPDSTTTTSKAAKHSSTISFARTVSHEVSFFGDDDDADWNLSRSDTDPSQFMPPADRTNSFPPVPPSGDAGQHFPAPTQAQDIMQEVEADIAHHDASAHFESQGSAENFDDKVMKSQEFSEDHTVGGDWANNEAEDDTARFEEGMPLIGQNDAGEPTQEPMESSTTMANDPFLDDTEADGGDDFFGQIQGGNTTGKEAADFHTQLRRKSTAMAMGDLDMMKVDSERPTPIQENGPHLDEQDEAEEQEEIHQGAALNAAPHDVDAKWAAAFDDDDDDFLLDSTTESKEIDPADFFGSDDEGFLDEAEGPSNEVVPPVQAPVSAAQPPAPVNGRYTPSVSQAHNLPPAMAGMQPPQQTFNAAPPQMGRGGYGQPPPKPTLPKAESFSDKSKGGYQSPYDLPMDIVKPMKRPSLMSLRGNTSSPAAPQGPPRATSTYMHPPPSGGSATSLSPPGSSHGVQAAPTTTPAPGKPAPPLQSKSSFFEDLPMASKPRPASRQSNRGAPQSPYTQASLSPSDPPQLSSMGPPPPPASTAPPSVASLVAPERASPYAPLQSSSLPKPSAPPTLSNRYSPAPAPGSSSSSSSAAPPAASTSRYSPAPPGSRPSSSGYGAAPSGISPALHPHQPRTSSPLAHFEITRDKGPNKLPSPVNGGGVPLPRSSSSQYDLRLNRVPSLPPTQEVDEGSSSPVHMPSPGESKSPESRYSPQQARHTPPPPMGAQPSNMLSPNKRSVSTYTPQPQPAMSASYTAPPRSSSGSPVAMNKMPAVPQSQAQSRPAHIPPKPMTRARGMSQSLSLVPPTDGRENDPLERWRGAPVITWGIGGTFITSFPKDVPRYGMNQAAPMVVRSPGEVTIKHVKDVYPLEEQLAKFPGPLKGKSKKKETVAWLASGIERLEKALPTSSLSHVLSHEDKRAAERVLLWKTLRVFVENDGALEGSAAIHKAVSEVISPEAENGDGVGGTLSGADLAASVAPTSATVQADSVDLSAVEQIRNCLLAGEREKAAWAAVDKRLWGHALLISNTVQSAELYRKVAQEFIKKEVNLPGQNNESLAALYGVLSGNYEEAVDELVPVHARAGFQLMSTSSSASTSQDALAGLDKWRETLGLILSNRSHADVQALSSLGNLLSSYGRAEAAHICYIFARNHAVFGGLDDPNVNFVLVGADHRRQADQFGKETEAVLLSEVYEYGLSLAGGSNVPQSCPHLAAYKLQHATTLAEYGYRDKALQYCDSIVNAIMAQTKRSQYYNPALESYVDDLMKRLKQAPKEESSSWIPKPSMNQVSSGMWSRFNKFVAGDDNEGSGEQSTGDESSPFARIASGTPTISRSPSATNFDMYGSSAPAGSGLSPTGPATMAGSRYAPVASQPAASPYEPGGGYVPTQRSSMERSSGELNRNSFDQSAYGNPYAPDNHSPLGPGFQPMPPSTSQTSSYMPATPPQPSFAGYEPLGVSQASPVSSMGHGQGAPVKDSQSDFTSGDAGTSQSYQIPSFGYEPPSATTGYEPPSMSSAYEPPSMDTSDNTASQMEGTTMGGYQPPSYQSSFEPPSYEPGPDPEDGDNGEGQPKKKSFMDDDEDDFPSLKAKEKSKADKDRENQEMFRKVAEEEAKRAAEAKAAPKKGWGLSGWFGGGAKKESLDQPQKAITAKLGEESSFVYDPDLKRWINKKPGAENTPAKTATPPPPRAASRNSTSTPPPPTSSAPPGMMGTPPPPSAGPRPIPRLAPSASRESLMPLPPGSAPHHMARSVSNQSVASDLAPPSRPGTSLSNASSIDDLIGAAGPRKPGGKKARKSGRYVDVMAK